MYYLTTRNGEPLHFNFYKTRQLLEPTEESLSQKDLVFGKQIKGIAISDKAYTKFTHQKLIDFTLRNFTVLKKYIGTFDYLIVRSEEGNGNDHLTLNQFMNNTIGYDEDETTEENQGEPQGESGGENQGEESGGENSEAGGENNGG